MLSGIFAERLRCALELSGKKQKELAQHIGVGDNIVSYYCNGVRKPTIAQLAIIAEFLGVTSDYLLGLSAAPTCDSKIAEKYYQDCHKKTEQLTINLSLDYQTAHGLYFRIADKLTTLTPSMNIPRAMPQTMEGEGWIRHNVPVYQLLSCDSYIGRTDTDESGLEAWLDTLIADMPVYSVRSISFVCKAVIGDTVCAELFKQDNNYASVFGHSYVGGIFQKNLYKGVWNATKKAVI